MLLVSTPYGSALSIGNDDDVSHVLLQNMN